MKSRICCYLMAGILVLILAACPKQPLRKIEETLGPNGGIISINSASLDVPPGALPENVKISLEQDAAGEEVDIDENEAAVSSMFTLSNDQGASVPSIGEPFHVTLPFDTAAVAAGAGNVEVFVKAKIEDETYTLMGDIIGNTIRVPLLGLPFLATLQVMYNAHRIEVEEEEDTGKILTQLPDWETTRWTIHLDADAQLVREAVGEVLLKEPSTVTREDIRLVVRERILRTAWESAEYLQGLGFRQPNLEVRTRNDGQKRLMLHLVEKRNFFHSPNNQEVFGQLNIAVPVIAWEPSNWLGTSKNAIAHEMFHAIVSGYDLKMGIYPDKTRAFTGYNEGMATVVGHTLDKGNTIAVRPNTETNDYSLVLSQPLGICQPRMASYTNHDFFAYVAKRHGGGTLAFLAGNGKDADNDKNGVLEQTRKHLNAETGLHRWNSSIESYLIAYRVGLHKALKLQFNESAANVYWDFARNRAYENNAESHLRPGDPTAQWTLNRNRFQEGSIHEHVFLTGDETTTLSYTDITALREIPPFATNSLVLNGDGFDSELTLTFETINWLPDLLGNSVRVKVYENGHDGSEVTEESPIVSFEHFGTDNKQVIILLSNVSVDGPISIDLTAQLVPTEPEGPCAPNGTDQNPWDRWLIEYDYDCDGNTDSDNLWHFRDDGTISDHWLGVISGYTWSVTDNTISISFGEGKNGMEAVFSEDCDSMENGFFTSGSGTCWHARKY
ncbi:MAG TPA: hypothetical protein PLI09_16400 [Candidatus Hydrogenedentes bacterium]|nr:hypothetical protein [Candidatus Hydrogenedentota bacterium]